MSRREVYTLLIGASLLGALIAADQFFQTLATPTNSGIARTQKAMTIAASGMMLTRRTVSLGCKENGHVRLIAKARLAERDFLEPGDRSPASIFIAAKSLEAQLTKIETSAMLIDKNWIDTVQTDELTKKQIDQIIDGFSEPNAEKISFMALERGIYLDATATSAEVNMFVSRCRSSVASAS